MAGRKNKYIKKAHEPTQRTPDQVLEFAKCMDDPVYFIETYVKIVHPTRGAVNFELYDYQRDLITAYWKNKDNIVLSARQTGKCCLGTSLISVINTNKITPLKRLILWVLDRKTYNEICKKGISRD